MGVSDHLLALKIKKTVSHSPHTDKLNDKRTLTHGKHLLFLLIVSTVNGVSPSQKKSALKRKEISFCVSSPWGLSLGASDFRALSLGHSSYSSLGTEYLLLCSCFMLLFNFCMWGSFLLTGAPGRSRNYTGCRF